MSVSRSAMQRSEFIAAMMQANGGAWIDLEELVATVYSQYVKPGDLVFDVGVNHGGHLVRLAQLVGPKGGVIGVEAVPKFMNHAREQLQAYGVAGPHITLHECAVAAQAGAASFFVTSITDGGLSGLRLRPVMANEAFERIDTETKTLDSLLPKNRSVRFAKIDIEGGEYDALRGAPRFLAQKPLIAFEFDHSAPEQFNFEVEDLVNLLWRNDYEICDIFGFKVESGVDMINAVVWNFLAVPPKSTMEAVTAPVRRLLKTRFPKLSPFLPSA